MQMSLILGRSAGSVQCRAHFIWYIFWATEWYPINPFLSPTLLVFNDPNPLEVLNRQPQSPHNQNKHFHYLHAFSSAFVRSSSLLSSWGNSVWVKWVTTTYCPCAAVCNNIITQLVNRRSRLYLSSLCRFVPPWPHPSAARLHFPLSNFGIIASIYLNFYLVWARLL